MAGERDNYWLNLWYGGSLWAYLLLPLTGLFRLVSAVRRHYLVRFRQTRFPVPVIVVGNISVGGTGKTPLIIALVAHLQSRGFTPGVISRGYGGRAPAYPLLVAPGTPADHCGDEPLSIVEATGCAVCVDPDRVAAARCLRERGCDVLLSDDGLQHYRLGRDLEIVVVDGQRGFGNGFCLPAGPLREPISRLRSVDWVVVNSPDRGTSLPIGRESLTMALEPDHWEGVRDSEPLPLSHIPPGSEVQAVAGIGNPGRFYGTLHSLGLQVRERDFPDHHQYRPEDFANQQTLPVVMTAKDAVKCRAFAGSEWYSLVIRATLPDAFWPALDARLAASVRRYRESEEPKESRGHRE